MIWIDFHGSTHGHFLEYVTNVWIMKMEPMQHSVFNKDGACHQFDDYYSENRFVRCGHWFWFNYEHQHVSHPVIRITFDKSDDRSFYIALVNRWYRSGDRSFEEKFMDIPEEVRKSPKRLRNQYYYKFKKRESHIVGYNEFPEIPNAIHEFKFSYFFVWSEFCAGLQSIAKFLNKTFIPDRALYKLWKEFISLNQGYQSYQKCSQILENIFEEQFVNVICAPYEEAWLNYNITQMTSVKGGPLFDRDEYPTNSFLIFNLIQPYVRQN